MQLVDIVSQLMNELKGKGRNEQFDNLTPDQLFQTYGYPAEFEYAENFKEKFAALSRFNMIHGGMLRNDLNALRDGRHKEIRMKMAGEFRRKPLKKYKLMHMHYAFTEGKMYELLEIAKAQDFNSGKELHDYYDARKYHTGQWIIYKKYKGKIYFIDIADHGDDNKVQETIETKIKVEYPFLFE